MVKTWSRVHAKGGDKSARCISASTFSVKRTRMSLCPSMYLMSLRVTVVTLRADNGVTETLIKRHEDVIGVHSSLNFTFC